jgi:hypothetical protein
VEGYFAGGSAQNDSVSSENNLRLSDMVTWTYGRHTVKAGANVPHLDRRVLDDNTNIWAATPLRRRWRRWSNGAGDGDSELYEPSALRVYAE